MECTQLNRDDRGCGCSQRRQMCVDDPANPGTQGAGAQQEWTIRPITAEEARACSGVIRESFLTVAEEFGITPENAPRFTAFAVTEERVRREMTEGQQVIACFTREGEMAGCYSLRLPDGDAGELNHLCVLPAFRHRHIGALLMRDALERAGQHGCRRMALSLVEENARLKRWYGSFGFVSVRTEKFDFFPFTCGYMERRL